MVASYSWLQFCLWKWYITARIRFWEEGDKSKCNVSLMTHHLMPDYLTDNCTHWSFHDYRLSFVLPPTPFFSSVFILFYRVQCARLSSFACLSFVFLWPGFLGARCIVTTSLLRFLSKGVTPLTLSLKQTRFRALHLFNNQATWFPEYWWVFGPLLVSYCLPLA